MLRSYTADLEVKKVMPSVRPSRFPSPVRIVWRGCSSGRWRCGLARPRVALGGRWAGSAVEADGLCGEQVVQLVDDCMAMSDEELLAGSQESDKSFLE